MLALVGKKVVMSSGVGTMSVLGWFFGGVGCTGFWCAQPERVLPGVYGGPVAAGL